MSREVISISNITPSKDSWRIGGIDRLIASIKLKGLKDDLLIAEGGLLIDGNRRLEACKRLGWTEVPVKKLNRDDYRVQLAEVDRRITYSHKLTVLGCCDLFKKRMDIYQVSKKAAMHRAAYMSSGLNNENEKILLQPFYNAVRTNTGWSERRIKENVMIASRITPQVRIAIRGTYIVNRRTALKEISAQPPQKQMAKANHFIKAEFKLAKNTSIYWMKRAFRYLIRFLSNKITFWRIAG